MELLTLPALIGFCFGCCCGLIAAAMADAIRHPRPLLDAKVLRDVDLKPGDFLVLSSPRVLTEQERASLRASVAEAVGARGKCVILEQGLTLDVSRSGRKEYPLQGDVERAAKLLVALRARGARDRLVNSLRSGQKSQEQNRAAEDLALLTAELGPVAGLPEAGKADDASSEPCVPGPLPRGLQ